MDEDDDSQSLHAQDERGPGRGVLPWLRRERREGAVLLLLPNKVLPVERLMGRACCRELLRRLESEMALTVATLL